MAQMVRARGLQEIERQERSDGNEFRCDKSIEVLQADMRRLAVVQEKMEQQMAAFVMGQEDATGGRTEVRAHMLGQFWSS